MGMSEKTNIYSVLAKAQANFSIVKDKDLATVSFNKVKYKYAPLDILQRAAQPALSKEGIFVRFDPSVQENIVMVTMLIHYKDQVNESTLSHFKGKDIKEMGGFITYLSRYLYKSMLGIIVGGEDDDSAPELSTPTPKVSSYEEVEAEARSLRASLSLESLAARWQEIKNKTQLLSLKEKLKKKLLEGTSPDQHRNRRIHALCGERWGTEKAHDMARIMGGTPSLKDAPKKNIDTAIELLSRKEGWSAPTEVALEMGKRLEKGGNTNELWESQVLPEYPILTPDERKLLWDALHSQKAQ